MIMFRDLRVDEEMFTNLDCEIVARLSEKYRSTNISKLCSVLRRVKHE